MISTALEQTAVLWKPIATAFDWVHQVATLLDNDAQFDGQNGRYTLERLLRAMERWKDQTGSLTPGIDRFLKVTESYAPGLFHCYDIEGLPRTNNDLEQLFGRWRHHQRRCTGRKVAPTSLVVRGSVQIVAAIATQIVRLLLTTWRRFPLQLGNRFAPTSVVTNTSATNNGDFAALQLPIWLIWSRNFSS